MLILGEGVDSDIGYRGVGVQHHGVTFAVVTLTFKSCPGHILETVKRNKLILGRDID